MRPTKRFLAGVSLFVLLLLLIFAMFRYRGNRGTIEPVNYNSERMGGPRRMLVYLPPEYPQAGSYPVLYLLHGAGDDEMSWRTEGQVDSILNHLYRGEQIVPMIVVMPNAQARGHLFEQDLLDEIIPYNDSHFATQNTGQARAIAGVSMGGGQALSIGLKHPNRFAWIGAFSASLAGKLESDVTEQLEQPPDGSGQRRLLWLSCGDSDQCRFVDESLHHVLETKQIPHVWHLGSGEHEWSVWRDDLRRFAPLLFR